MDELLAVASLAGRVCVGLVFAGAALQKMRHWRALEGVIRNYHLLPPILVKPTAWMLPPAELVLGIALLGGVFPLASALVAMLLLLVFAATMVINIRRGRPYIDCGCHQSFLRQTLKPQLVGRNLVLIAFLAPSLSSPGSMRLPALATGIAAGLAFFLLYLAANAIAALPDRAQSLGASP